MKFGLIVMAPSEKEELELPPSGLIYEAAHKWLTGRGAALLVSDEAGVSWPAPVYRRGVTRCEEDQSAAAPYKKIADRLHNESDKYPALFRLLKQAVC